MFGVGQCFDDCRRIEFGKRRLKPVSFFLASDSQPTECLQGSDASAASDEWPRVTCGARTVSNDVDKFYRVIAELDRLLIPGTGDGFWSARSIFSEMDRSFLNGWSICHLKEILDEKELLVFRDRNTLTINVTKGYAISVALIDRPPGALYLFPQHYMARNVGRVPLKVRRYNPDRPVKNDIYDPDVRLELREEFELKPGEALERNGHADVLDWESGGPTGHVLRLHS